jgi:hypothetical protein
VVLRCSWEGEKRGLDRYGVEDSEYAKRKNRGGRNRWVSSSQAHSTKTRTRFHRAVQDGSLSLGSRK